MKAPIAARYHIVHSYPSMRLLSDMMHHNPRSDFAAPVEIAEAPAIQPPIRKMRRWFQMGRGHLPTARK